MASRSVHSPLASEVAEPEELEESQITIPSLPAPALVRPTFDMAFAMLCEALIDALVEEIPAQLHAEEILGWYENKNYAVAWQHAITLLESVLGVSLRA